MTLRSGSSRSLVRFHPTDWLDRAFEIGVIFKGLNGLVELIGGVLLLTLTPADVRSAVRALTQPELSTDPHDVIARALVHSAGGLTHSGLTFGAAYLLLHGAVKIVLVTALLRNQLWAYPWMIAVLLAFIAYQTYRIVLNPTLGLMALTTFDATIALLTWREHRRQRANHQRLN